MLSQDRLVEKPAVKYSSKFGEILINWYGNDDGERRGHPG